MSVRGRKEEKEKKNKNNTKNIKEKMENKYNPLLPSTVILGSVVSRRGVVLRQICAGLAMGKGQ